MKYDTKPLNHSLRNARQEHGWSQKYVAEKIGTTEDVISRWEHRKRMPSPYYQEKLCQLFQKNAYELEFIPSSDTIHADTLPSGDETVRSMRVSQEQFAFGDMQTTWIILDGDGIHPYTRQNILSYFEPIFRELPLELKERREQVAQQQEENRKQGLPFHWNGQRYSLNKFVLSREGMGENPVLDLWFSPSEYYTFLATNMALDDQELRDKYLKDIDWSRPVPFFANSFGVQLVVRTADNTILLSQRAETIGIFAGNYSVSICEGIGIVDANSDLIQAPSLYNCAERGLNEELGLNIFEDFHTSDIQFLSFGVDSWYLQWALLGTVTIQKTAQVVRDYIKAGIKDRRENAQIYTVPFTVDKVVAFIFAHKPWMPGSVTCLYHTLIHEFGIKSVKEAIDRHMHNK
jgi:transcriptional regulator with XRE-family HTH domain